MNSLHNLSSYYLKTYLILLLTFHLRLDLLSGLFTYVTRLKIRNIYLFLY
jgi:hypothetical protein